MVNETDLSQEKRWYAEERARIAVKQFRKRNINAQYVSSCRDARNTLLDMIPPGARVVRGDSVTIDQIGIVEELQKCRRNPVIYPLERKEDGSFAFTPEERNRKCREAFSADVFLSGSNAVTLDGKLVNTDGVGNRVAPMLYGPDKVIVVAGVNKLVRDVNEALLRIRNVAAPLNARRHFRKHRAEHFGELPCVKTGVCADCSNDWRICHYTVIIEGAMGGNKDRINLVLVGEELGI